MDYLNYIKVFFFAAKKHMQAFFLAGAVNMRRHSVEILRSWHLNYYLSLAPSLFIFLQTSRANSGTLVLGRGNFAIQLKTLFYIVFL